MNVFVFSQRGDRGETSLLSGERVSKASLRPEAYGTLDEASSALGLAKVFTQNSTIRDLITRIQEDLVTLGAELSFEGTPKEDYQIKSEHIDGVSDWIAKLQEEVPLPRKFILPGGNPTSASVDLARTIIRRAERRVMRLREAGLIEREEVHSYLNRLADLLFTLARYAEVKA